MIRRRHFTKSPEMNYEFDISQIGEAVKLASPRGDEQLRAEIQVRSGGQVVTQARQDDGGRSGCIRDQVGFGLPKRS